jgi:ubiquinone/menaquinone biosynthesis C-methylase UbiE
MGLAEIKDFWNRKSCGEVYATGASALQRLESQSKRRYELEPYLLEFARFSDFQDRDVLEIGVGMGSDHVQIAQNQPRSLTGIDLTERAIGFTKQRLEYYGFQSDLAVANAEELPFGDDSFDIIYSWGVLHHSENTPKAVNEVYRVLRPGGKAKIMIYHKYSMVGYILWLRYSLLTLRFYPLSEIYAKYLESPGTKAYTVSEARRLFERFSSFQYQIQLGPGDLMLGESGQRHHGILLKIAKKLWPRWLIQRLLKSHGTLLMIEAVK